LGKVGNLGSPPGGKRREMLLGLVVVLTQKGKDTREELASNAVSIETRVSDDSEVEIRDMADDSGDEFEHR
jgi:hypothetical protein